MAKERSSLDKLLQSAGKDHLVALISILAAEPDIKRRCIEYLTSHVNLSEDDEKEANAATAWAMWLDLEPDLAELNVYGGGPDEQVDHVSELLYDLEKHLAKPLLREERRELLAETLSFIRAGNAGMDDQLWAVAYATCQDDDDLL